MWKVELLSDELEYLAEKISKQSVEVMAQFLLAVYNKPYRGYFTVLESNAVCLFGFKNFFEIGDTICPFIFPHFDWRYLELFLIADPVLYFGSS